MIRIIIISFDNESEDMDFSLMHSEPDFNIENYFGTIQDEFLAAGRNISIKKKKKSLDTHIESAFLKDNTDIVNILFQTEPTVKIKIEVDKNPPLHFKTEYKLLLLPFSFMTRCFTLPGLFAGKMHALLFRNWRNRVKGRDWYDFEWYIRNNIRLDFDHFKVRAIQSEGKQFSDLSQEKLIELLQEKFTSTKIENVKADVRRFIRQPAELEIWSSEYFLQLLEYLRFEN